VEHSEEITVKSSYLLVLVAARSDDRRHISVVDRDHVLEEVFDQVGNPFKLLL